MRPPAGASGCALCALDKERRRGPHAFNMQRERRELEQRMPDGGRCRSAGLAVAVAEAPQRLDQVGITVRLNLPAEVADVELFAEYPGEGERRFLAMRLRQMREDTRFQTWCEHAFVVGGQMVGHGGYDGPPGSNAAHAPDAVEFGYAIFAP
jgi:hypothetical protein